jgi:hypothetical protein
MDDTQLRQLIADALRRAGLPDGATQRIKSGEPRQLGRTAYQQVRTRLVLPNVPLSQLATFLHHLTQDPRLKIRDLRLRMPHGQPDGNNWDADAVLTYLIYSPTADAS